MELKNDYLLTVFCKFNHEMIHNFKECGLDGEFLKNKTKRQLIELLAKEIANKYTIEEKCNDCGMEYGLQLIVIPRQEFNEIMEDIIKSMSIEKLMQIKNK